MIKFIPLVPSLAGAWDRIAHDSDDAWLFHLYDWLPLTESHWDLDSKSFLVEFEGKIVGIFPLQLNKKSKSLRSTTMGLGGPALINGLQDGVRKKIMKAMHEQAHDIALAHHSPFIEVLLGPLSEASLRNQWQVNPLVHHFYEDISTHTWMVDLKRSAETIFSSYADDARRSIKIAGEKGYVVSLVSDLSDIERFYQVHCETRKRTGVSSHPKGFFIDLYKNFCSTGHSALWQAKDSRGQAVAFEVTGLFKKGALYWMGCCQTEHLNSGVNYLLQHHAILWAKEQGMLWFENGEAFPNIREGKQHGLTVFKGKFGGQLHRFFKGRITLRHPGRRERFLKKISGIFTTG